MVFFPLIRIYSSVTYPDMLPPHKVRLNKKSTTLRLTMIFKQTLKVSFRQRLETGGTPQSIDMRRTAGIRF